MKIYILKPVTSSRIIGVFSTMKKAKAAGRKYLKSKDKLEDDFYWRGDDNWVRGYNGERQWDTDELDIRGVEVDVPKFDGYNL